MRVHNHNVGLVFAALFGGFHLVWEILVFSGLGQRLVDFIFWAHMIHLPIIIGPFETSAAAILLVFTSGMGYIIGTCAGTAWNFVHKN